MTDWMILLTVTLLITAIGFKNFVWFLSIGYSFAVAGLMAGIVILFFDRITVLTALMAAVMTAYALRLGIFLAIRELSNENYKKVLTEVTAGKKTIPFFISVIIWITVSALYFAQISPLYFRMANGYTKKDSLLFFIGILITVFGLYLQARADREKDTAKKINPNRFCDTGLYRIVRCPNYFGEILVWTGMFAGSITCAASGWQLLIMCLGYAGIVYVMFNGARRLEKRQNAGYGNDPEYEAYCKKVPILIPLLPVYSLEKAKFLG